MQLILLLNSITKIKHGNHHAPHNENGFPLYVYHRRLHRPPAELLPAALHPLARVLQQLLLLLRLELQPGRVHGPQHRVQRYEDGQVGAGRPGLRLVALSVVLDEPGPVLRSIAINNLFGHKK